MNDTDVQEAISPRLEALKAEHRDLDYAIATLSEQSHYDQVQVQRLKKRKLKLREQIDQLEGASRPDIIA